MSGLLALPRLVAGCTANFCLPPTWAVLTHTDRLNAELEKQRGAGNPSESLSGRTENMRQLPTEQSAPEGVEGTSKSGRALQGWGDHGRPRGRRRSDLIWFLPFDKKEIRSLL